MDYLESPQTLLGEPTLGNAGRLRKRSRLASTLRACVGLKPRRCCGLLHAESHEPHCRGTTHENGRRLSLDTTHDSTDLVNVGSFVQDRLDIHRQGKLSKLHSPVCNMPKS